MPCSSMVIVCWFAKFLIVKVLEKLLFWGVVSAKERVIHSVALHFHRFCDIFLTKNAVVRV